EQDVPPVRTSAGVSAAAVAVGVAAAGPLGAVHPGYRPAAGPVPDLRALRARAAGLPASRSADDGGAAPVWVLRRGPVVAEDRAEDPRGRGVPGDCRGWASRPLANQQLPASAPGGAGRPLCGGSVLVPEGRTGETWLGRAGRNEGESERVQAQGDELRAHEERRPKAARKGLRVAGQGRAGRRGRGRRLRQGPQRRRATGGSPSCEGPGRANPPTDEGAGRGDEAAAGSGDGSQGQR